MISSSFRCALLAGVTQHALAANGTNNLRGAMVRDPRDGVYLGTLELAAADSQRQQVPSLPDAGAVIGDDMNFLGLFESDEMQMPEKESGSDSETEQDARHRDLKSTTAAAIVAHEMDEGADKLIVGGNYMRSGERSFCMSLDKRGVGQGTSHARGYCGGTLISDRWILTAGHCLSNSYKNDLRDNFDACYMNAYKPWTKVNGKSNGGEYFEIIPIQFCVEHPNHSPGETSYDFALCKLQHSAHPSLPRAPIAHNSYVSSLEPGTYMRAVGLGHTSFRGSKAEELKEVYVPLVPDDFCRSRMSQYGTVDDTMVCAGGEGGKDACGGDSGGPLFHGDVLVGVTSWGYECAWTGIPGVYAKVGKVIRWISEQDDMQVSCHIDIAPGGKGLGERTFPFKIKA